MTNDGSKENSTTADKIYTPNAGNNGRRLIGRRKAMMLHNIVSLLNLMAKYHGVVPKHVLKHVAGVKSIDTLAKKFTTKQLTGVYSQIGQFEV